MLNLLNPENELKDLILEYLQGIENIFNGKKGCSFTLCYDICQKGGEETREIMIREIKAKLKKEILSFLSILPKNISTAYHFNETMKKFKIFLQRVKAIGYMSIYLERTISKLQNKNWKILNFGMDLFRKIVLEEHFRYKGRRVMEKYYPIFLKRDFLVRMEPKIEELVTLEMVFSILPDERIFLEKERILFFQIVSLLSHDYSKKMELVDKDFYLIFPKTFSQISQTLLNRKFHQDQEIRINKEFAITGNRVPTLICEEGNFTLEDNPERYKIMKKVLERKLDYMFKTDQWNFQLWMLVEKMFCSIERRDLDGKKINSFFEEILIWSKMRHSFFPKEFQEKIVNIVGSFQFSQNHYQKVSQDVIDYIILPGVCFIDI